MRSEDRRDERGAGRRGARYALVMVFAMLLGLGLTVPVFAVEESASGGGTTTQETAAEGTTAEGAADEEAPVEGESASSDDPRIVGGKPVPDRKYRFMAALRDIRNGPSVYQQQYCAGTLIDQNSVLTAAHCIRDAGVSRNNLRVTVGATVLSRNAGQTRLVRRIDVHPRYRQAGTRKYDAAVLTLGSNITGIKPVVIPATTSNAFERPGRSATIAGWGSTARQPPSGGNTPSFPYRMRETQVPIARDSTAKRVYGREYATRLMIAAGREGKDTCQGDSGGPIFFSGQNARYQVGITSFGAGCGARGYPGVYAETNSPYIRPFIMRTMQ